MGGFSRCIGFVFTFACRRCRTHIEACDGFSIGVSVRHLQYVGFKMVHFQVSLMSTGRFAI